MRPLRIKIVCYTDGKQLNDLEKVLVRSFSKDYFNTLGVNFYSFTYNFYIKEKTRLPVEVYVWAVNKQRGEIELLRNLMKGARGVALMLDINEKSYKEDLEWFIEKIVGSVDKIIPFLLLVKVNSELIEKIEDKIFDLVEKQFELASLSDYPFWVDFYSNEDLTGIIQGFESLLILIYQTMLRKKETRDN